MKHTETQGIYLRGGVYWLQLPMKKRIRPKPITLQTGDLGEAIKRAAEARNLPSLQPSGGMKDAIARFPADKRGRSEYSASTAKNKGYTLGSFAAEMDRTPAHSGALRRNPAVGVNAVAVPDGARKRFCTKEQQDKLINECPREDLKLVLMLGFHAGFRKNEIKMSLDSIVVSVLRMSDGVGPLDSRAFGMRTMKPTSPTSGSCVKWVAM